AEPARDALLASDKWSLVGNLLSAHSQLCAQCAAAALRNLRHWRLCHGYCRRHQCRYAARSLVHRTPVVALDLLANRALDAADDALRLPPDPPPPQPSATAATPHLP